MRSKATTTQRKATNISLDARLLQDARDLDINISRACEQGLAAQIEQARAERWRADNAEAIASSNSYVERHGLPLAEFRRF